MPSSIQIGSILIKEQPLMAERLGLESDFYSQNWSVVRAVNGFSLAQNPSRGLELFLHGGRSPGECVRIHPGGQFAHCLAADLPKVRDEDFNCPELTGIVARSLLWHPLR